MDDKQTAHAMGIDDTYRVERTLARGQGGVTELVSIDGIGPFVRKKIPSSWPNATYGRLSAPARTHACHTSRQHTSCPIISWWCMTTYRGGLWSTSFSNRKNFLSALRHN